MSDARNADLGLVVALLVAATAALLGPAVPRPIAWPFGILLLVALPGYALVAALFPVAPGRSPGDDRDPPGWVVRAALSVGLSAVVVAVVAVPLTALGSLTLVSAVLGIDAVALLGVVVAATRRRGLSADRRADAIGASPGAAVGVATTRLQVVVTLVAAFALVGALAFAGAAPASSDAYSEAYLLGPDGTVPDANETMTLNASGGNTVGVGLANHEGVATEYGVVVQLQQVGPDGTVRDQERLDAFDVRLGANETRVASRTLDPAITGDRLRLRTLVYEGGLPSGSADADEADLSLRVWVDVAGGGSG